MVLHLAAQPLVRQSYKDPLETFHTNALGVANLLNACRKLESLRAVVIVNTDKVSEHKEWLYRYRECDSLGGYDPYSASKACAEIITDSMRRSFFSLDDYGKKHSVLVATARAGNVIGGGDFSRDRLLPDLVRAAISREPASIRYPSSTRPWQFVCESLQGYLLLAQALLAGRVECASSFNFGPSGGQILRVSQVLELAQQEWEQIAYTIELDSSLHESGLLALDSSKASSLLGFSPLWSAKEEFVCESLQGYLLLAQALLAGRVECASSFNFGPSGGQILRVSQVLELAQQEWEQIAYTIELDSSLHESGLLALDSSKASSLLGFSPLWSAKEAIQKSVAWYRAWSETSTILSQEQLGEYMDKMKECK